MHAPLFTAPVLLVEQPRHLYANEGHYEVLAESGRPLAYVNEHMNAWSPRGGDQRPHRFTIYGTDGHPLLTLDKPWDRGRPYIYVTGPHGEPYGSIVQDRSFMGSRFRLNDARGHTVAEIRGDWNGWDFTVLDHAGIEIARIGKEHPGLIERFFTTEDRYALEFAYDLPWPLRRLVIGAAITIDVLLHEREPEFYHSHYADFGRHPEYGYQPRHHWHHPRRGYIVTRRVRPPLVVHETFRPARRSGYVPVRERVVEPRGGYRTHGSRSGAGRASAAYSEEPRRTARADRRAGGGFASRSESSSRRAGGGFASRSESPSSGASARRERQGRSAGGGRTGGGSTSRSSGLFGGGSGGGSFGSGGSGGSTGGSSSSRSGGASRSSGSSRGSGGGRSSGGSSRSSGGFRSAGGRSSGGASRSSGGFRSASGRSSGGSSRSSGGRSSSSRSSGSRSSSSRSSSSRSSGGSSRRR
ncbi:LURP-one-related/scramblase family protein [Nocardiopsis sp. MG754419]|uniref:LURP-one-related/scramblase family protein n=1 Tax=Nocardiopsis sp. MG754419 TaxID=2259865 RepID=UPI001BA56E94|nr:phospholipid scramblase-related protein [Nocardiopsis sp. MG754419]MBR8744018.1 scramblase [Nocardiopsis sp. MG754419]